MASVVSGRCSGVRDDRSNDWLIYPIKSGRGFMSVERTGRRAQRASMDEGRWAEWEAASSSTLSLPYVSSSGDPAARFQVYPPSS